MLTDLKKTLGDVKENNFIVPKEVNINELIEEMMNNIGNTDPELRDDLIYLIMSHWIMNNQLPDDKLSEILKKSISDDFLFYKIGETNTDTIFTRSFSVLLIPPILIKHRENKFLTEEDIKDVYIKVVDYYVKEKDVRGFVDGKGWAHSAAHGSDALDDLAICSEIGYDQLIYILDIIKNKVCISNYVYVNEEDERMVTAIKSIIDRNLITNDEVCLWIKSFSEYEKTGKYPQDHYLLTNIKNLLRSLYFRLLELDNMEVVTSEIKNTLDKISNYN